MDSVSGKCYPKPFNYIKHITITLVCAAAIFLLRWDFSAICDSNHKQAINIISVILAAGCFLYFYFSDASYRKYDTSQKALTRTITFFLAQIVILGATFYIAVTHFTPHLKCGT